MRISGRSPGARAVAGNQTRIKFGPAPLKGTTMAEAVAGAISYFATGTYVYGATAYLGYAYAIVFAAPAAHGGHQRRQALQRAGVSA
jgi:hypothetical protein